jgi:N-acetylmuramoyl-L-alanine amidase CwlA
MKIIGEKKTRDEFETYVKTYDFGSIKPSGIVLHHTWKPTKEDWNGKKSIDALKRYYEGMGWKAGPHIFVAEDGVWLFTPMYNVGIHAGVGNSTSDRFGRITGYTIGIEVVGNYDKEVWSGKTKNNVLSVLRILKKHLGIDNEKITFHRDWMPKTCPGNAITKAWVYGELEKLEGTETVSSWAFDGWQWQRELGLDLSVIPQQQVTAEWIFTILKKLQDINKK